MKTKAEIAKEIEELDAVIQARHKSIAEAFRTNNRLMYECAMNDINRVEVCKNELLALMSRIA